MSFDSRVPNMSGFEIPAIGFRSGLGPYKAQVEMIAESAWKSRHGGGRGPVAPPVFVAGFVDSFKLADMPQLVADEIKRLARLGVSTLAALHRVDWQKRRAAWGEPQLLTEEMRRLDHLIDRPTVDPKDVGRAGELRDKLRSNIPETRPDASMVISNGETCCSTTDRWRP